MPLASLPDHSHALITGASQGLGLALCRQVLAAPQIDRVYAISRQPQASAPLQALIEEHGARLQPLAADLTVEDQVAAMATNVGEASEHLHLVMNVAGLLHDGDLQPEKRLAELDPAALQRLFAVNAIAPALVLKHLQPRLRHRQRCLIGNLSARVGSIGDNRLGGWYGYRASKAAQNQLTRTAAIELRRYNPALVCVALHPGTTDTVLSQPFQAKVPAEKLFSAERAATQLLAVLDARQREDNGGFFAWDGQPIPW